MMSNGLLVPTETPAENAGSRLKSCRRKWSSSSKEGTNLTTIRAACTAAILINVLDNWSGELVPRVELPLSADVKFAGLAKSESVIVDVDTWCTFQKSIIS